MTQPTVQNRLMKFPVTRPMRASHSLLAEPPPVTMKWGGEHDADYIDDHDDDDGVEGKLAGRARTDQGEELFRQLVMHDAETVRPRIACGPKSLHHGT